MEVSYIAGRLNRIVAIIDEDGRTRPELRDAGSQATPVHPIAERLE